MDRTASKVINNILADQLIKTGDNILLSLSAGKDSMAMLNILFACQKKIDFSIAIFHLNHLTRQKESDLDQKFLQSIAKKLKIKIYLRKYDFSKKQKSQLSFEEQARKIRYQYLDDIAKRDNFNKIATAHNKDDQVETILMRIFSGTGLYGLQGIKKQRLNIIRPLLSLTSEEIYQFLKFKQLEWREDSSNLQNKYLRNHLRNELIPLIKKKFPGLNKSIVNLGVFAQENHSLFEIIGARGAFDSPQAIFDKLSARDGIYEIELNSLDENIILIKHLISQIIRKNFQQDINQKMMAQVSKNIKVDRANLILYENKQILIEKIYDQNPKIRISNPFNNKDLNKNIGLKSAEWQYTIKGINKIAEKKINLKEIEQNLILKLVDYNFFAKNKKNKNYSFLKIDNNINSLLIRNRRQGDKISLKSGTKKIKELFIEKKLSKRQKEATPLVIINSKIVACLLGIISKADNRIASDYTIKNRNTKIMSIYKEIK